MTLVHFSDAVVARLASDLGQIYGLSLTPTMVIEGETDASIRMASDSGEAFLVKARPDVIDAPELIWQEMVHVRLAEHSFGFEVPHLVPALSGALRVSIDVADVTHVVRVLSYLEGELMSSLDVVPGPEFLSDLGAVSAQLTAALGDLVPPPGLPEHFWVLTRSLAALHESLDRLPESAETRIVRQIMAYAAAAFAGLEGLPVATVHQDLNTHNVLVNPAHPVRVQGVIDFNDTVRTVRVADIAIAAGYAMLGSPAPLDAFVTVVHGYVAEASLTEGERYVLFPLGLIRLCVNWTTWLARSEGDATSYAASRMRATWPTIAWVMDAGIASCHREVTGRLG